MPAPDNWFHRDGIHVTGSSDLPMSAVYHQYHGVLFSVEQIDFLQAELRRIEAIKGWLFDANPYGHCSFMLNFFRRVCRQSGVSGSADFFYDHIYQHQNGVYWADMTLLLDATQRALEHMMARGQASKMRLLWLRLPFATPSSTPKPTATSIFALCPHNASRAPSLNRKLPHSIGNTNSPSSTSSPSRSNSLSSTSSLGRSHCPALLKTR